jgi:hypothetical protein
MKILRVIMTIETALEMYFIQLSEAIAYGFRDQLQDVEEERPG